MNDVKNIKLYAQNIDGKDGFNIYINFSGQREFLMYHRHNGLIYNFLKDGVRLDELYRGNSLKVYKSHSKDRRRKHSHSARIDSSLKHILMVADDYIEHRDYYCA